jgi:hypothetical protein
MSSMAAKFHHTLENALCIAFFGGLLWFLIWFGGSIAHDTLTRTKFCLDQGYDTYETVRKSFYCHNTATGKITPMKDPALGE